MARLGQYNEVAFLRSLSGEQSVVGEDIEPAEPCASETVVLLLRTVWRTNLAAVEEGIEIQ